jgi:MoaA/NifB/PqqE/SkfB family radical SAM enzyme
MNGPESNANVRYGSALSGLPFKLKFRLSFIKYLLQKKKYPLFVLSPSKGGLLKTQKTMRKLGLFKAARFDGQYYLSLTTPRWPSRAFDRMVARGGLNLTAAGTPLKSQVDTAILAITRQCAYDCKHCYERFNLGEEDVVPIERWKEVVHALQEKGVSIITFSGGEPMLRFEGLLELVKSADKDLSDIHVHTSGNGVTAEKALAMKQAGVAAVAVGLDDVDPSRNDEIRGSTKAYEEAVRALQLFRGAGLFTYINMCLTKDMAKTDELHKFFLLAKSLGVGIVRFLEPKPCGGYLDENMETLFSDEDRKTVTEFYREVSRDKKYKDYPIISYEAYFEKPEHLGCMMGGLSHFHIDSMGNVEPCVFMPVSFGNIMEEDIRDIFARMREAIPSPIHKDCPVLSLSQKIREKKNQGNPLPIPFMEIEGEWQQMLEEN